MSENMNLILAAPPEHSKSAVKSGFTVAHMAYRINHTPYLFRADSASDIKGGIMAVDARKFVPSPAETQIVSEIIKECQVQNFGGILLDIDENEPLKTASFCQKLDAALKNAGLRFYVSFRTAKNVPCASVLIETAISGGTLSTHLKEASLKYGARRIALDIERVRMDFKLPAYDGNGRPLSSAELSQLYRRRNSSAFFSKDLCANYFTYRDGENTHFVLYDNAASIKKKLSLAHALGIKTAFLFYPEVEDIINELRGK